MLTGGRVLHHLARRLPDPTTTVILVGFQAEGTRGRRLLEGAETIKLLGRYVPGRADVVEAPVFSVHADADELAAWVAAAPEPPGTTYVVSCPPGCSSATIWGTGIYSDDSAICTAAVHAGVAAMGAGGTFTVTIAPGQASYPPSTQFGVTSSSWGSWNRSFAVTP